MTGQGAGIPREDRPGPILLPDGFVVPGALCAELAAALALLEAYTRGTPPPAACRQLRLSHPVAAVLMASKTAAARHQAQRHQARAAWAAPTSATPIVLGPAQLPSGSKAEEITTTEAADLAGFTPEWWRRLAVRGTIRARQVDRRTWLLTRSDVVGYANRAGQETPYDREHDGNPQRRAS